MIIIKIIIIIYREISNKTISHDGIFYMYHNTENTGGLNIWDYSATVLYDSVPSAQVPDLGYLT